MTTGSTPKRRRPPGDELVSWAEKLTKSDGSQYGYSIFDDTTGEALNFYPIPMVNYGGNLANDDNTKWLANTPRPHPGVAAPGRPHQEEIRATDRDVRRS